MKRAVIAAAAALATAALAGCGGSSSSLKVSAASSLKGALTRYAHTFGDVSYSFAGSDELAAQIRAGAKPDVFAAANTKIPDALYAAHLVEKPVPFASNTLVLAVPANSKITTLADAAKPGMRLATGSPTVPVGAYTLTVLGKLGSLGRQIRDNVRSQEPDDASIVGKLITGAVDGGFVYVTDITASKGALKAVSIPASAKPTVTYEAAVVVGTHEPSRARRFVSGLVDGAGHSALTAAGFGAPQ